MTDVKKFELRSVLFSFVFCLFFGHAPELVAQVKSEPVKAIKVDEFGDIQVSDKVARLDNLAIQHSRFPDSKIFIIVYRTRLNLPGVSNRLASQMMNYLVETRGIPASSVIVVDGGLCENLVQELWIVPLGTAPVPRTDAYHDEIFSTESATKFDEYNLISREECQACYYEGDSVDGYAAALRKLKDSLAYVIYYPQYVREHDRTMYIEPAKQVSKAMTQLRSSLLKRLELPKNRVKVANGGFRRWREVELWIVPSGVHVPVATPNVFRRRANHALNGLPQRLQNLALRSFWAAPQDGHACAILRLAPQEEQKSEPATFAAPHVPHRPGRGGT